MNQNLITKINTILQEYNICNHCLIRIFKNIPGNHSQKKLKFLNENIENKSDKCVICNDLLSNEDKIITYIKRKIKELRIEFNTFVMACQIADKNIISLEKEIHEKVGYKGEDNLKKQFKRDIGSILSDTLEKEVDFNNPEVIILFKVKKNSYKNSLYPEINKINVFIDSNPLFIEGKYRKLVRGIPQTKWPCSKCKGKGCPDCDYTGKQYKITVEDLIADHLLKLTEGDGVKFHGSGREDIDVLMLGEGRPFVIEVKHPFKRNINLKFLRRLVNSHSNGMIEINDLKFVGKKRRAEIKNSSVESYKVYSALAEFDKGVTSKDIENIERLTWIDQRTPTRVSHRRADLIRQRLIKEINVERINSKKLNIIIKCQGGLYIKELISGDNGRTIPNVSFVTDKNAVCTQLNVLKVHLNNDYN